MAQECARATEANLSFDNSWEPDDERLPFVYRHWIKIGAPSAAKLMGDFLAEGVESDDGERMPPAGPTSAHPPHREPLRPAHSGIAANPPHRPSLPASTEPSAMGRPQSPPVGPPSDVAPSSPLSSPVQRPIKSALKGKGRMEDPVEPEDLGDSEGDSGSPLRIHRHAQFTMEKQKKVTDMTEEFLDKLRSYAREENLDSTAVMKVFERELGVNKLSAWQAYERLVCLARGGSGKPLPPCPFLHAAMLIEVFRLSGEF
jgi:hypothetical protein